jgi:Sulfotransferase domain
MSLAVIGPGFGRTGTMSLKHALEQLGFGPCHHMEEVFAHPEQVPHWQAVAAGPKAQEVQFPKVGERDAVENGLTNWVSLGGLVKRFNNALKPDEQEFKVDCQVVIIRDGVHRIRDTTPISDPRSH